LTEIRLFESRLLQMFKDKGLVANLPGVKMKREYKALIDQQLGVVAAAK
jgi:hypothetical protein